MTIKTKTDLDKIVLAVELLSSCYYLDAGEIDPPVEYPSDCTDVGAAMDLLNIPDTQWNRELIAQTVGSVVDSMVYNMWGKDKVRKIRDATYKQIEAFGG